MTIQNLSEMLFPVSKVENPAMTNSEYAYIVRGDINGQDMDLNYCSKRYELVPNELIFPRIESDLEAKGLNFTVSYEMIDHVRFYAKYTLEDENLAIGTDLDRIKPVIVVTHSYNGLTKYSITFGYFRLICSNGLTVPVEGQENKNLSIVGKHTKEIINSFDQLWSRMDFFFSLQDTIQDRFNSLADHTVNNVENRVEKILEKVNLKPSKAQLETLYSVISAEANDHYNGIANDWLIYNGINAYIYKGVDAKGNVSKALPEKKAATDAKVLNAIFETYQNED